MTRTHFKLRLLILKVAMLFSIVTIAFAEGAPVYDADNYSPQAEGQADDASADAPSQVKTEAYEPAPAPTPSITPQEKSTHLEQQVDNLESTNKLTAQINVLQNEVQALRGQVEEQGHQLQQLQNQVRSNYADLDKRLTHLPVAAAPVAAAPAPKPTSTKKAVLAQQADDANDDQVSTPAVDKNAQPNVAEEQQIYQTAYNYIKAKKYNEAVASLQAMLKKYPSGQFAANAHYWLGELYGLMNKNDQAATEFSTIIKSYPNSPKISDAHLKLGLIYASQSNWSDAKSMFKKIINKYPGTTSAHVAAEQLKQLKLAGH